MLSFAIIVLPLLFVAHADDDTSVSANGSYCKGNCTMDKEGNTSCIFTAKLDFFASEWGYFTFKECGNQTNPTLELDIGATYIFNQFDASNWYHPLGFSYYPDGAHDEVDELEPSIAAPGSGSKCAESLTCPAPMYMLNNKYLGKYSNNEMIANETTGEDDFGLDHYEPKFFLPVADWWAEGKFSVMLKLDDSVTGDIFYFCHIHQFMTGRIKVTKNQKKLNLENTPAIPYEYETPSEYDQSCGTTNLESFRLPNKMCPGKFVCDLPTDNSQKSEDLRHFSSCITSTDCAMFIGMTNKVSAMSEVALFIHQMIPHHQNAVNMAKALLKTGKLSCDDITEENDDCTMTRILYDIVNGQNHQIQLMRAVLEGKGYPESDQCLTDDSTPTSAFVRKSWYGGCLWLTMFTTIEALSMVF